MQICEARYENFPFSSQVLGKPLEPKVSFNFSLHLLSTTLANTNRSGNAERSLAICMVHKCFFFVHVNLRTPFDLSFRRPLPNATFSQVRVVRHQSFVISVLCFGTALVGAIEAAVAFHVRPWWLQVLANAGFTLVAFVVGFRIFGFSHAWVLRDPRLEKPLFVLDVCVVS